MRVETVRRELFTYEELSEGAKARAREWYVRGNNFEDHIENIYANIVEVAKILGIEFDKVATPLVNNTIRYDPAIYFSGFSSQGDGACFTGRYAYKKGAVKAARRFAPKDAKLARIAAEMQSIQRRYFYKLVAIITHRDWYYHARTIDVEILHSDDEYRAVGGAQNEIKKCLVDFADWIYEQLEKQNDYQNSDDVVAESIIANGYEFLENGERA